MGSSNTTLFTHTKDNSTEAKKTIRALPTVLQAILTEEDYSKIQGKVMGNTVAELTAVQQMDNTYLDELLTIHHYTEIDVNKKRKKIEENTEVGTAVSGLTQVSLTSSGLPSTGSERKTNPTTGKDSYAAVLKGGKSMTEEAAPPSMITILQQRMDQQTKYIEQMQQETAELKSSMALIQQNMILDQKKEEVNRAWQTAITAQLTKANDTTIRQDKSIADLKNQALQTTKALQKILDHLKNSPVLGDSDTHPNPRKKQAHHDTPPHHRAENV